MNLKYLFLFITIFHVYGADLEFSEAELRKEQGYRYIQCTLFGKSTINPEAFDKLYNAFQRCFFEVPHRMSQKILAMAKKPFTEE